MLSTYSEINPGINTIRFTFEGNMIYSEINFTLSILVKKVNVNLEVISQNCIITENHSFEMELEFYYYLNNQKEFLNEELIKVEIFRNQSLIYRDSIKTFENGKLFINLSYSQIASDEEFNELRIKLTLNETYILNKMVSEINAPVKISQDKGNSKSENFQEALDEKKLDKNEGFFDTLFIYFPFCFFVLSLIMGILYHKRNRNPKMLSEIHFQY
jgi:hypothetical protein